VEQDHRGVKRVTRPMLGFKSFDAAQYTLTGVELMHMLRKGQLEGGSNGAKRRPNSSTPWQRHPRPVKDLYVIAQNLRHIPNEPWAAI